MDELEFECAGQAVGQGVGGTEAAGMHFGGVELGCGAEFLDAHGADGEFLACELGQQVETVASGHPQPVGEVGGGYVLVEHFADVAHELVHVEIGFVDVVEHVVALGHVVE